MSARRPTHQRLDGMEGVVPQHLPDEQPHSKAEAAGRQETARRPAGPGSASRISGVDAAPAGSAPGLVTYVLWIPPDSTEQKV